MSNRQHNFKNRCYASKIAINSCFFSFFASFASIPLCITNALKFATSILRNSGSLSSLVSNLFMIKTISAIMSPTGKEINVPIPTFGCVECNHVNKTFIPDLS